MKQTKVIITIDDNLTNLSACKNILKPYYEVFPVSSAAKLFELLKRIKPDLILLDVAMPELSGYEIAKILKHNDGYRNIPIIFVTAMTDEDSEMTGRDLGALDYIHKPYNQQLLLQRIERQLALSEQRKELEETSEAMQQKYLVKMSQVLELQNAVIQIVADLVEFRDNETGGHAHRTQAYIRCMIEKMLEEDVYSDQISAWDLDFLLPSSQLHDLGKIAIPDAILNKPGKLTPEEYEIMKTHVTIGRDAIHDMERATKKGMAAVPRKGLAGRLSRWRAG